VTSRSWVERLAVLLLLASGCAAKSTAPPDLPLPASACWDPPSCFEVLERSSDLRAVEHAAAELGKVGAPAIPRLAWQVRYGHDGVLYGAALALGHVATVHPGDVRTAAGDALRELCADRWWAACWAAAQAQDREAYPIFVRHLRRGDAVELFSDGKISPSVAEWFVTELENRRASTAVLSGVLYILERTDGPLSLASLERVRQLLAAEPAKTFERWPRRDSCRLPNHDCWSRGDYLVTIIGVWRTRGVPARAEVRRIWQSAAPPHQRIARRTLARMGDRAILPSIQRDLTEPTPADHADPLVEYEAELLHETALQDLSLLGPAARPEVPELIARMQKASGRERQALLAVIQSIGGPLAVRLALEELRTPPDDDTRALAGLELAARDPGTDLDVLRAERPRLTDLATQSAFFLVRKKAEQLLVTLGFEEPDPGPLPCPPVIGAEHPKRAGQPSPRAKLASGTVVFRPFDAASAGCADDGLPAFRVAEECLRGRSHGEYGHEVMVHERRSNRILGAVTDLRLNPVQFLRYGDQILVIEGLFHMIGMGSIDRLERSAQGQWRAHAFADLPGAPVGYAFDANGDLLLLVAEGLGLCSQENGGWQVVRIDKDGHTTPLP